MEPNNDTASLQEPQVLPDNSTATTDACQKPKTNRLEKAKVALLAVIATCLVILVLQNFFNSHGAGTDSVWVQGGHLTVSGTVDVDNTVPVELVNRYVPVEVWNEVAVDVRNEVAVSQVMNVINTVPVRVYDANTLPVRVEGGHVNVSQW